MRQRLIDDQLYEFTHIHPRYNVSKENGYATSCAGVYCEDFDDHCREKLSRMAAAKRHHASDFEAAHDIFVIHHWPWLHFTAMSHPCTNAQAFTPVITLGKHVQRLHQWHMPIAIQAHHGLVEGIHLARLYEALSVVRLL